MMTIVDNAVEALKAFGNLNRKQASTTLSMWKHNAKLTPADRRKVLSKFKKARSASL